jgi:hypothetical protein
MNDREHAKYLLQKANQIDELVVEPKGMTAFREQFKNFEQMRLTWEKGVRQGKDDAKSEHLLTNPPEDEETKPPKQGYIWDNYLRLWRSQDFPPDPMEWMWPFTSSPTRQPTKKEQLMCDYVLLAALHEGSLGDATDKHICFRRGEDGMWRDLDEGSTSATLETLRLFFEQKLRDHYADLRGQDEDTRARIDRAINHVQADLAAGKRANRVLRTLKIIGGVIGFMAALLTCLYYLGWLEPIKAFIYKIVVGN